MTASSHEFFDHLAKLHASKANKKALEALRRFLGPDRHALPGDYMDQASYLEAYLRYYLPLHLPELPWILEQAARFNMAPEPGAKVLDLGSGPGTLSLAMAIWAKSKKIPDLEFTLMDRSKPALALAESLMKLVDAKAKATYAKSDLSRTSELKKITRYDWILAGHMLNEWGSDRKGLDHKKVFLEILMRHAMHERSVLVIVEPPLRDPTIDLMKLRDYWVNDLGGHVMLPCPGGTMLCPALRSRMGWCYTKVQRTWARAEGYAPLDKKVESFLGQELHYNGFSYMVLVSRNADREYFSGYTKNRRIAFSDERRKPSLWCRDGRVSTSARRPKHRGEVLSVAANPAQDD